MGGRKEECRRGEGESAGGECKGREGILVSIEGEWKEGRVQEGGGGECRGSEGILVSIEGEWKEGRKSAGEGRGRVQG